MLYHDIQCLYARIPSASGFGGGFVCLHTFSQGIWSTIGMVVFIGSSGMIHHEKNTEMPFETIDFSLKADFFL